MSVLANRFLSAVRLCTGPLAIKKRLTLAWMEHLDGISPDELPGDLQQDFIELRKAMYMRDPLPMETAPQASIRKMSATEATTHADTIIALYTALLRQQTGLAAEADAKDDRPAANGKDYDGLATRLN